MRVAFAGVGLLLMSINPYARAADFSRGEDRLGVVAPRLELQHWLHSPPLEMDVLRMGRLRAIDIHPVERKPSARHG